MKVMKPMVHRLLASSLSSAGAAALVLQGACGSSGSTSSDAGSTGDGGTLADVTTDVAEDTSSPDVAADAPAEGGTVSLGFTPSNFDPSTLSADNLADIDVTVPACTINSETGSMSCVAHNPPCTVITQTNQIKVGICVAHSWRVEPNAGLGIIGSFPLILVATDKIDILGSVTAAGMTDHAVAGGYTGPSTGTGGAGSGAGGASTTASAGGGGSYCGTGGMGAAVSGSTVGGGATYGTPQIVPLIAGSAGGGGALSSGVGGGALQLVAANSVSVETGGSVNVGGGGGGFGPGGGGGSGGSLLIESKIVTVAGTLAANGGGGGACATGNSGADGQSTATPAAGGTKTSIMCTGGNGSAGTTLNGTDGVAQTTTPTGAGGGGGGAGRIRINTTSGMATTTGGTVSPDLTTTCASQGMVR
jgi:hypothetical protein